MTGIYKITNLVNDKVYIGQAIDIEQRWFAHKSMLKNNNHHSKHLQNAWNKYGAENFKFEVIEECEENELTKLEQYWIDYYEGINSNNNYNGRDAGNKGKPSTETRKKMKENHADVSGKNNPMYGKQGGMLGKHHTEEYKQMASKRFKGKNNPMYGKHNDFNSGRIYINNGIVSKMIYPKDLDLYIQLGYKQGRLPIKEETKLKQSISAKNSLKRKNRFWINNGKIEFLIQQSVFEEYQLNGFIKGRLPNEKLGRRIIGKECVI